MNTVNLTVNGKPVSAAVEPRTSLADFLRDSQDLTGTHLGCEHGVCGACTILLDGVPARSCITLAASCEQAEVTTVEGLDDDEIADELRAGFSREHGLQCGYCTPGMIVSARDLVLRLDEPDEQAIRVAMSGNLCRCTGYVGIVRAVAGVIRERRSRGIAAEAGGGRKALGPAGSGFAGGSASRAAVEPRTAESAPRTPTKDPSVRQAVPAQPDRDWTPDTKFGESFVIAHPADVVWDFFGRVEEVAACLPGASLSGPPHDDQVEGSIRVKVGPMTPEFQGVATVSRDEPTRTGTITGSGRDRRSNSVTRGRIAYEVKPGANPQETRVEVTIGYTLTGMLAQFGRSGLVRDVAKRLIAAFVANLETRLAHPDDAPRAPAGELNAGSVLSAVVFGRIRSLFARLVGKG